MRPRLLRASPSEFSAPNGDGDLMPKAVGSTGFIDRETVASGPGAGRSSATWE